MPKHTKLFYLIILSLPVLAMLLLARWNYIQADDYMCHWLRQEHGFWGMQQWIYLNNTGRYTSAFLAAMASEDDLIFHAPWLFPIVLIIAEITSLYILCRTIFAADRANALLLALALFLLHINIIPEPATAIYWFSGAATYQVSFILCFLLASSIYMLVKSRSMRFLGISSLLILLIGGTNELSALIMNLSVLVVTWHLFRLQKIGRTAAWVLSISALIALLILFISPGIHLRRSYMPAPELPITVPATAAWAVYSIWNLFKEPSFWLAALVIFYLANTRRLFLDISKNLIIGLSFIQLISLAIVLFSTHGSIPLRMMNVYTALNAALLFLITGKLGSSVASMFRDDGNRLIRMFAPAALAVFIFSSLSGSLFQSFLSAPFAKTIQQQWISSVSEASRQGKKYIALPSYQESADSLVNTSPMKSVMKDLARRPPELLHYNYSKSNEITFYHLIVRNNMDSVRLGAEFFGRPEWAAPTSR